MMAEMEKRSNGKFPLMFIRLIGFFSICFAIKELITINNGTIILNLAAGALFYLIFSPLVVTLPSGANWRPGMAFILFSLLNFDYKLVIFVAIPGTLFGAWGKKGVLSRFFLTVGHLSMGIYAAGMIRDLMHVEFTATLISYLAITICLLVHFSINRLVQNK